MAESSLEGFGDRAALRRALVERLGVLCPELRVVAEGFRGEESSMDALAVGGEGELVSIRFAKPADDRATLTRALADLTWLRGRRSDLLKLAPGLGIDPSAEPCAMVLCRAFSAETRAAVDNLPDRIVTLWQCRADPLAGGSPQPLRIEPLAPAAPGPTTACRPAPRRPAPESTSSAAPPTPRLGLAPRPVADPPSGSTFRTGLSSEDLERPRAGMPLDAVLAVDR